MNPGLREGLFAIFMAFVILAGMVGLAWGAARLIGRNPKCSACGWREGHRMDCSILNQLVDVEMRRERAIIAMVKSGEMEPAEAMRLIARRS